MNILQILKDVLVAVEEIRDQDGTDINHITPALARAIEYIEKQEPVAWLARDHSGAPIATSTEQREHIRTMTFGRDYWIDSQPLFTYPPSSKLRELSDEEIDAIWESVSYLDGRDIDMHEYARAILAAAQEEVK